MQYFLEKKPKKGAVLIEGFPGYGLVGTIATEYLIRQIGAKPIGHIKMEEVPPVVAVHHGCPVEPLGIFYAAEKNVVILHALSSVQGFEWDVADTIVKLAREIGAKELVSLEGVGGKGTGESLAYYIHCGKKDLKIPDLAPLEEGIIMGVSGALLLKKDIPLTCFFAETHSTLPDSRAAVALVKVVNRYLSLGIDIKPLVKRAEEFEGRLRELIKTTGQGPTPSRKDGPGYFG